ncbi:Alpha/Beta hydrolase protein [Fusarium solani]|uniref:Alpha/Beta hydrolase protein n=1 Tax=Fusarium solani TaxID=169388 RepID=A0A9P9G0K8_FUSSL|nr:Alpha/Beta hydrolase protein [Fusarium solani]KAH7230028.1 Alpha/Beta hydrolase protein [Fusarium solani]
METKEYTYATLEEGAALTADVYYKPGAGNDVKAAQPIVILIYGGGFVAGSKAAVSKSRLDSLIHDSGFTVVVPDYRHCSTVSVFDGPVTDIHNCYSWTREKLPALLSRDTGVLIDGSRVVVIGSSAGGTLVLHLASASPPPKAIVSYFSRSRTAWFLSNLRDGT